MGEMKALWQKKQNLIAEIEAELKYDLSDPYGYAVSVVDKVLDTWAIALNLGNLLDDMRSVVDTYRKENQRLEERNNALESEIAELQRMNREGDRLVELLEDIGKEIPTSCDAQAQIENRPTGESVLNKGYHYDSQGYCDNPGRGY